jgi:DNA-binding CsgD family transcriptional regulator
VTEVDRIRRGRRLIGERAWREAFETLAEADREQPLGESDLELLATAAFMLGRDEDHARALERAHHLYVDSGAVPGAVRCAFWVGLNLATRGELGPASGWFSRAQRLLASDDEDSVERGYLMLPTVLQHVAAGEWDRAISVAAAAAEIGERFADRDLFALAAHEQGHALVKIGRAGEGFGLLDEAMVAATAEELSPVVTGLVYCSVIAKCRDLFELRRAQEWTAALTAWCDRQPEMVAYTGQCLVHRAEIMQLRGAWPEALDEAQRAGQRFALAGSDRAAGNAAYTEAEVHRLRGEDGAAERAYAEASRRGWEPQPGLALLRLTQGEIGAASASIRRSLGENSDPLARARLLPAYVEIALAGGEPVEAETACEELEKIAEQQGGVMLEAMAASARGAVDLARDDAAAALVALRRGWQRWEELDAPYDAARARALIGLACRVLGDGDAAALELAAARSDFEQLGAAPDLSRLDQLIGAPGVIPTHGLTPRELEVLRLVAAGNSNREIASKLIISEHTVARHLQNIFAKLGVSSRTAASAYGFEHGLI